ncbi:MAG TPA: M48 family metalloprotease [Gemmatimonadaceae bacterium]|nr:M48 family metalloprotease [Gemmatimonadaceae bacterium]
MPITYPVGPATVPPNLTQPPASYRRRVWLAVGGLLLFVTLYVALTGWLGWTSFRLLAAVAKGGNDPIVGALVALGTGLLTVFMVKGFFFMKQGRGAVPELEVTAADQPELFAFLHTLADEAGAPRPHRVFVSPRVNASVFYDLTLLNLVFPSKKNLEIGLGLVNVLTLGELKAVLAHEFGHFAQRSMAVGRWVYVAQQIAAHIVGSRGKLDTFLLRLSRIDPRVGWIGWLLRAIVWSIRSVVDSVFLLALRMQRALGREMEMHADLVAVSLTGSDTPIYALHRLRMADDAFDRAMAFARGELAQKRAVTDLFAVQSRIIERMSGLSADETYRPAPPLPATRPERFRLFAPELAQPPRMWSTHPANDEREANAKRVYIPSRTDDRSGWLLFGDADALRAKISALALGAPEGTTALDTEAAMREIDSRFARESLDQRYRGIYRDRPVTRYAKRPSDLYATGTGGAIAQQIAALYPQSLSADVARLGAIQRETALLRSVVDGIFEAPGGIVRHRGRQLRRGQLPGVIEQLEAERTRLQERLAGHDRRCRAAHRAAAAQLKHGWEDHLAGLAAVLHYAEHGEANIRDAERALANRVGIATAGGRVGKADIERVIEGAKELYAALQPIFAQKREVVLDPTLAAELGVPAWEEVLEEFKLNPPTRENISSWLDVAHGWVAVAAGPLGGLRECALDRLLATEAQVARWAADDTEPPQAPPASRVPAEYPVLLSGGERQLQRRLPWIKRFQTADGAVPAVARFLVAASILAAMLGFGGQVGEAKVTVYNGLARAVRVVADDDTLRIEAFSNASLSLPTGVHHLVTTTATGARIEAFDVPVERGFGNYVYNVASAAALVEWEQAYGDATAHEPRMLGGPRWTETEATVLFAEPPSSISTQSNGGTVGVLSALASVPPSRVLSVIHDQRAQAATIAAHARWDSPSRRYTMAWMRLAQEQPGFRGIVAARLAENPHDMLALRGEQDAATGSARDSVCVRTRESAAASPDDPTLQYLATRCLPDEGERNAAYIALSERWPSHPWLALAAGYSLAEDTLWAQALARLDTARTREPGLAVMVSGDVARIRRMMNGPDADVSDLRSASDELDGNLSLETGDGFEKNSPYRAYAELAQGRLERAMRQAAKGSPELRAHIRTLAAASDDADPAWADSALALASDSAAAMIDRVFLLALAARERRDLAPHEAALRNEGHESVEPLIRFVETLQAKRDPVAAERTLGRVSPGLRGLALSAGCVVLGAEAPAAWRDRAKRLTFAAERPHFR